MLHHDTRIGNKLIKPISTIISLTHLQQQKSLKMIIKANFWAMKQFVFYHIFLVGGGVALV